MTNGVAGDYGGFTMFGTIQSGARSGVRTAVHSVVRGVIVFNQTSADPKGEG